MSRSTDSPGVIVFPPALVGGTLLIGLVLHWLWPMSLLPPMIARVLGVLLLLASATIARSAERVMHRAGTNIQPSKPTLAIVTDGPFRFTRNPLYVALIGLYLGITLLVNAVWPLLLLVPMWIVLDWGVVRREEQYLEAKFGEPYLAYQARVRRWI